MSNTQAGPTKQEIEAVFSRLRAQPTNKSCFDCAAKAPTWSSVTYGIFICIDCSAVHRNLGVHLTFVRSTNLDTNWTWLQLRQMQLGGNANASQFFRAHNCNSTDAQVKYNSRAAQLYRDKLAAQAMQALKVHGLKLHMEHGGTEKTQGADEPKEQDDFFAQCDDGFGQDLNNENNNTTSLLGQQFEPIPKSVTPTGTAAASEQLQYADAPSVDLLNAVVSPAALQPTIGVRKIQPKKTGLGARKIGGKLGATKVNTNFADIEARASAANQYKEAAETPANDKPLTEQEELESVANMRLAYQDLSLQQTRQEAKLKSVDPAKAKQMERLGMGFNLRGSDVSHSALSDMETIQQTAAPKVSTQSKLPALENDSFFNDYSPNMYSGCGSNSSSNGGGGGGFSNSSSVSKLDKHELEMMGFETIEPIGAQHKNITSMFGGAEGDAAQRTSKNSTRNKTNISSSGNYDNYNRKSNKTATNANDTSGSAQQKFGNAKGFGSEQYFATAQPSAADSTNLMRFQGSTAISSEEYFGDDSQASIDERIARHYTNGISFQPPDLEEVKESVRQGVHIVAGRLSNLANDVMSSLNDKYGH